MLAAGAAGPVGVYFDVVRVNLYGAVIRYFGDDLDQRKRGVPAP